MAPPNPTAASAATAALGPWIGRALEVGGGIIPALRALGAELSPRRRAAWDELCETLAAGDASRASRALEHDPDTWIPLLTAAAPGATTGDGASEAAFLARAVDVVVTEDTKSRWWLPLVYPFLVTVMAITVTSLLAVLVVPEFEKIHRDFGMRLPLMTEALLGFSHFLREGWGVLLAAAAMATALWLTAGRGWPSWLRLPGSRFAQSGRFARFAADLLAAGVPQPVALAVASRAVDPQDAMTEASTDSTRPGWLSATVRHALDGNMPAAARVRLLDRIATCHALRLAASRSWLSWGLGPVAVFVTGLLVFLMVIALFMPLVNLVNLLS
jgi:type II secretory pathway component PulF